MWSHLLVLACALLLLPAQALGGPKEKVAALAPSGLVLVMDEQGNELVAQNADKPFVPASVAKIVTAWLALEVLGADYRFETRFYLDGKRVLYIRGWRTRLRVVDVEFGGFEMTQRDEAEVYLDVLWLRDDEATVRSTRVAQRWRDERGHWELTGEERREGDTGLLGEPPPEAPRPTQNGAGDAASATDMGSAARPEPPHAGDSRRMSAAADEVYGRAQRDPRGRARAGVRGLGDRWDHPARRCDGGAWGAVRSTARPRHMPCQPAGEGLAGAAALGARGFLALPATSVGALDSLLRLARSFLAACALRRLIFIDWRQSRLPICFNLLTVGGAGAAS